MTDKFELSRQSVLLTTTPLNFTQETSVQGFIIGGEQPEESERKFLFEIEGKFYKFVGNTLTQVFCEPTLKNVLEFGNTAEELSDLAEIPAFVGKVVFPLVALKGKASAGAMPSLQLGARAKSISDIFSRSETSPIFELGKNARFVGVNAKTETTGGATATLQVRLRENGIWSEWKSPEEVARKICQAVQLRGIYTVSSTGGSCSAKIVDAEIFYTKFFNEVTCSESVLYLAPEDFDEDLTVCAVAVKHPWLKDCELSAFISYDDFPIEVKNAPLGTGTGEPQTFTLESNIDFATLIVEVDGLRTFDFTYNSPSDSLTITAPLDKEITVSYKCNVAAEDWQEMENQGTIADLSSDKYLTRFIHRLDSLTASKIAKVKVVQKVLSGSEKFEIVSTGYTQAISLPHNAIPHSIICNAQSYKFEPDSNILFLKSPAGNIINVSYDWQGRPFDASKIEAALTI